MYKLCNDELMYISKYIQDDRDFMNFRKTMSSTYNIHYRREVEQTRRIYVTMTLITYLIVQIILITTILYSTELLWLIPIYLGLIFYTSYGDFYYDEDRIYII